MSMRDFDQPSTMRNLRACMVCSILQTNTKFLSHGCPNCEEHVNLRNNPDNVRECTSQAYEGVLVLMDPNTSWVARWQRLDNYVPGMYAVKVQGMVPDEVIDSLDAHGIKYVPRDGSAGNEEA